MYPRLALNSIPSYLQDPHVSLASHVQAFHFSYCDILVWIAGLALPQTLPTIVLGCMLHKESPGSTIEQRIPPRFPQHFVHLLPVIFKLFL